MTTYTTSNIVMTLPVPGSGEQFSTPMINANFEAVAADAGLKKQAIDAVGGRAATLETRVNNVEAAANTQKGVVGMNVVIPSSVAFASVGGQGRVSFGPTTSFAVNGCFSSAYDHYVVHLTVTTASAAGSLYLRPRTNGTDYSSGGYRLITRSITNVGTSETISSVNPANQGIIASLSGSGGGATTIEFFSPNSVNEKTFIAEGLTSAGYFKATAWVQAGSGAFDGFDVYTGNSTNITGTCTIYGFTKG